MKKHSPFLCTNRTCSAKCKQRATVIRDRRNRLQRLSKLSRREQRA